MNNDFRPLSDDRVGHAIGIGLTVVLFFTVFAIGGVHGWASAVMEICLWGLGLAWFAAGSPSNGPPRAFQLTAALLFIYVGLQLVPLSRAWIAASSPATAELYAHTAETNVETISLSLYPFATLVNLLRYLGCGVALWLAATLPAPMSLLRSSVVTAIAVATVALVQYFTWNGHLLWLFDPYDARADVYYPRMTGPFVNPNHCAAFIGMALAPAGALLAMTWGRRQVPRRRNGKSESWIVVAVALALGMALMVAALIGSSSRGGIVGAALGLVVMWLGARRRGEISGDGKQRRVRSRQNTALWLRQLLRRVGPGAMAAAILIGGFLYAGPNARKLLDVRIAHAVFGNDIEGRVLLWKQTVPIVGDFPLFGVGLGCWREIFYRYQRYPVVGVGHNYAHSDYVDWCAEVGLIGVALTVALGWAFVRWARSNQSIPPAIRWGIAGGIVAVAWHEIVDFNLRIPADALLFSVLLGLLCNENWGHAPATGRRGDLQLPACRNRRSVVTMAGAALACALLMVVSVWQFREFWQWLDVRNGSTSLRFAPRNGDTWLDLGKLRYKKGFRYDPVTAESFRAAIERRPTSAEAYWGLSLTATTYAAKLRFLEAALYLHPTKARWRLTYASILDMVGRHEEALEQIEEVAYRDPRLSSHPYLDPANERLQEPLLERAEKGFQRALADRPNDAGLMNEIASFYSRFGIWGDAARLWVDAAEKSGNWMEYGSRAGESYAQVENFDRAEDLFWKGIEAGPDRADGYRLLAMTVYRPQKRYLDAEKTLEQGIRRSQDRTPLYASLYDLRMEQGRRKEALEALASAADSALWDAGLQIRLGSAYLEAEDYHRAKIAFDRAIEIDGNRAEAYYHKGLAFERLYDLGGARDAFRRAVELDSNNTTYSSALRRMEEALQTGRL